jgi:hypothetical protein
MFVGFVLQVLAVLVVTVLDPFLLEEFVFACVTFHLLRRFALCARGVASRPAQAAPQTIAEPEPDSGPATVQRSIESIEAAPQTKTEPQGLSIKERIERLHSNNPDRAIWKHDQFDKAKKMLEAIKLVQYGRYQPQS